MTKCPKIKFKISYKKDINTLLAFEKEARYNNGRILSWAIRRYPKLNPKDKKGIEKFVRNFYKEKKGIMGENLNRYRENWAKKEKDFYYLTEKLFPSKFWPEGRYVAYLTIWGVFPRFLKDKTFQIPYKYKDRKDVNIIIAHEMLHFIFYNYFFKKFPKYKNKELFVWHISEVFNNIIQNSPKWVKTFELGSMGYPEHKYIVKKLVKEYYRKKDQKVDDLIKDIIKTVKKNKKIFYFF